jgi:hypothetical protein
MMTNTHRHSCAARSGYGTPLLVKGNYFGQIDIAAALWRSASRRSRRANYVIRVFPPYSPQDYLTVRDSKHRNSHVSPV